jgi:peptide/nickel transport system substrate-binding protein
MLRAGEIDAVRVLNLASADALESESGFEVPEEPAMRVHIALLNHARPPFNDLRVRQAAALAIDMERMSHAMTRGRGEPANALIPQQLTSYEADAPGWDYDPERARRLIEEAGATGSEVIINMTAPDAAWEMSALILQSYWRKVGLNVKIQKMDQALQQQRQDDGDYDAAIEWWYNETTDPDLGMKWAFCGSCGNRAFYTNYQNDRVDELTALGVSEMDPEKRLEIYKELHRIAFEEVAQIPLYFSPWLNGYSTNIEGLRLAPNTQWTLEETRRVR